MSLSRRTINSLLAGVPLVGSLPLAITEAHAQSKRDSLVLGMILEPTPGLDPTMASAAAIGEIVHYNIFEGLTKIAMDGAVTPLLADNWYHTPDGKTYTFTLKKGIKFSDGAAFDASAVKFSFDRARAAGSTNKAKKAVFDNISSVVVQDAHTVILVLNNADALMPFRLGENTAVILHPGSAASAATKPVGTGPYKLDNWAKGSAITLVASANHRDAAKLKIKRVTFRFINDPAAQVAALLAGDIDGMPRFGALQSTKQFQGDKRFTVEVGSTSGKGIVAINNKKAPLNDVRVRRAIAAAIDRAAVIESSADGFGVPIGSYYVPGAPGYVDTTALNPYDPAKARALLKEAARDLGFTLPLQLTMKLPPTPYARQGGEVVAALLAQVGIKAKIENVEWAQWLSGVYGQKAYDLTLISHVEPLDFGNFARPNYYWGYDSAEFKALWSRIQATLDGAERNKLMAEAQRLVARDAVSAYLYQPTWLTVADARLRGLWKDMPLMVNDLAVLRWE